MTSVFLNHISSLKRNGDHVNGNVYYCSGSHLYLLFGDFSPTLGVFEFISMVLPRVFLKVLWAGANPPLWPVLPGKSCTSVFWEFSFEDEGHDAQAKDTVSSYLWTESPLLLWTCFMQGPRGTWLLWLCSCHQWGAPCLLAASDLSLAVLKSCRALNTLGHEKVAIGSHTFWYTIHTSQSLSWTCEAKNLIQYQLATHHRVPLWAMPE